MLNFSAHVVDKEGKCLQHHTQFFHEKVKKNLLRILRGIKNKNMHNYLHKIVQESWMMCVFTQIA